MKSKIPRLTLSPSVPGADRFNKWLDDVLTIVENTGKISTTGILTKSIGPTGINLHVDPFPIQIVKTTSTITARSGATAGTGTVAFQTFNPPTFAADASRGNVTVYNYSANTTLTVSGKYGIALKIWKVWFLVIVEC